MEIWPTATAHNIISYFAIETLCGWVCIWIWVCVAEQMEPNNNNNENSIREKWWKERQTRWLKQWAMRWHHIKISGTLTTCKHNEFMHKNIYFFWSWYAISSPNLCPEKAVWFFFRSLWVMNDEVAFFARLLFSHFHCLCFRGYQFFSLFRSVFIWKCQ